MKDGFSDRAEVEVYPEGSAPRKGSAWMIRFVADCIRAPGGFSNRDRCQPVPS